MMTLKEWLILGFVGDYYFEDDEGCHTILSSLRVRSADYCDIVAKHFFYRHSEFLNRVVAQRTKPIVWQDDDM